MYIVHILYVNVGVEIVSLAEGLVASVDYNPRPA